MRFIMLSTNHRIMRRKQKRTLRHLVAEVYLMHLEVGNLIREKRSRILNNIGEAKGDSVFDFKWAATNAIDWNQMCEQWKEANIQLCQSSLQLVPPECISRWDDDVEISIAHGCNTVRDALKNLTCSTIHCRMRCVTEIRACQFNCEHRVKWKIEDMHA
jgi:hypothetical protein